MDPKRVGTKATATISVAAAGVATWVVVHRHDRERVVADPEYARLSEKLEGRPVLVTSDDGTVLYAEVHGPDDAPTIVLSHGWACSRSVWQYQVQALRGEFRVVTYDQRGHGRSERAAAGDYSTDALAADLRAVVRLCVPDGERTLLVGHSMGAMAVVAWADEYPQDVDQRLAGAVLANTCMAGLVRQAKLVVTVAALGRLKEAVGRSLLGKPLWVPNTPMPVMLRAVKYVALGPDASPAQAAFCEQMFLDCHADVRAGFGATLSDLDQHHAIASLRVPVVVIVGKEDRVTPPRQARRLSEALPDAELVELRGVGHMAPLEAHAAVTKHIEALARRLLPSSRPPVAAPTAGPGPLPMLGMGGRRQ